MHKLIFSRTRFRAPEARVSVGRVVPPDVGFAVVRQQDVPVYLEWTGSLSGHVITEIPAQVSGYLLRRSFQKGQRVQKGDLLFEIDDRPFKAALDQATALLHKTESDLQRLKHSNDGAASQKLDDAIQANLARKADVEAARLNLLLTKVTSPINGVAGCTTAKIGSFVGPGSRTLTTLTGIDPIHVHFFVHREWMPGLQQLLAERLASQPDSSSSGGLPAELILPSGAVYPGKGHLRFDDDQSGAKTGFIRLTGGFPNPRGLLLPGMVARVRVQLGTEANALLVPHRTVTRIHGRSLIAVIGADHKVSIRPVTACERFEQSWVIEGPVKAGDRVVAEGVEKMRDGAVVNPVPSESPASFTANLERQSRI